MFFLKKYLMENAENTISEPLDFKMFWGMMPPDPHTNLRLPRSFAPPTPPPLLQAPPSLRLGSARNPENAL